MQCDGIAYINWPAHANTVRSANASIRRPPRRGSAAKAARARLGARSCTTLAPAAAGRRASDHGERRWRMRSSKLAAEPYPFAFEPAALRAASSSTCSATSSSPAASAKCSATTCRNCGGRSSRTAACWRPGAPPVSLVLHTREGHRPDLVRPAAGEEGARPQRDLHRRSRPDGPHPGARRARPRHHRRALPRAGRARHRQARQGRVLRHRPPRHARNTAGSSSSSSPA